jgi:hypothetical protein
MYLKRYLTPLFTFTLLLSIATTSPLISFADDVNEDDAIEGSAFDSMEDLVSEFDEELNDSDLEQAIQAESAQNTETEPEPEPEPAPEPEAIPSVEVQTDEAQVQVQDGQVNVQTETAEVSTTTTTAAVVVDNSKTASNSKVNALLILKAKQTVKIWINKRYRGIVKAGKAKPFPVRAGQVVVTAKANNQVRRFVKQLKAKTKTTAQIDMSSSKRARVSKATKKRIMKKQTKKAVKNQVKKAVKKRAKKNAKKRVKKAIKKSRK